MQLEHRPLTTTRRYRRRPRRAAPPPVGLIVMGLLAIVVAVGVYAYAQDRRPPEIVPVPVVEPMQPRPVATPSRPAAAPVTTTPTAVTRPSNRVEPAAAAEATPPVVATIRQAPAAVPPPAPAPPRLDPGPSVIAWQPMTPDSLTRVRHIRSDKPATVAAGSFAIATTMPDLPEVVCDWSIPLADDLSPMASAVDIACLFPYPTEDKAINGLARVLHRHWGFTTLSIRFPGMGSMDGNDRRRFYYYPESGSGAAWIAAISRVREIGGFPNRPVFVTGRSGGGSAAGLFADAHPEMVAAVANEAGRVFALPPRFTGPVLLMHGHHDYVAPAVDSYTAQITGNHVTRITFPPSWAQRGSSPIWQHGINGPAEQAMWHWLAGVANLRLAKGVIPPRSAWPGRFDGVHLPDAATAALVTTIPRPYRAVKSRGGSSGEVVFAQPLDKPKGIIALIGNSFASDLNDMALDAEFLANDGWLAVAVTGQGSACTGRLRDALADTAFTGTQQLPWMLVVDEADGISDLMSVRSGKPAGIMLRGAQRSQVRQIMEMPPKLRPSVTIIGLADAVNMCRNMDWPTPQPTWRTVNANNRGSWQRESSVAIRAQAQAWIAALAGM